MTQVFKEDGLVVPVTAVAVEPNVITQIKTEDKDGYRAIQVGFGRVKKISKAQTGHLNGLDESVKVLREFCLAADDLGALKRGDKLSVSIFEPGDEVQVVGTSKGRGFQGVVKRHGFSGSPATHGHKDQERMSGSIGATSPSRVFKGMRMGGRMGNNQVTVQGLEIIEVDQEKNILYIKGAVPGAVNGLLLISGHGEIKLPAEKLEIPKVEPVEAPAKTKETITEAEPINEITEVTKNE